MSEDVERILFEEWTREQLLPLKRGSSGEYESAVTRAAWDAWRASADLYTPEWSA